jgi:hypothetical protein
MNSSVGDELSYLEAPDAPEGPPCQRMLTRINNKVQLNDFIFLTEAIGYQSTQRSPCLRDHPLRSPCDDLAQLVSNKFQFTPEPQLEPCCRPY